MHTNAEPLGDDLGRQPFDEPCPENFVLTMAGRRGMEEKLSVRIGALSNSPSLKV